MNNKKTIPFEDNKKRKNAQDNFTAPEEKPGDGIHSETAYPFVGKPFLWWWTLTKPVRSKLILAFILTTASMSMITIGATITGWFVDDVYGKGDTSKILLYCIILVAVPVVRSILGLTYRFLYETSSLSMLVRLRAGIYKHLQSMDGPFYDKTSIGDLMARMTGDLDMSRHFTAYVLMASLEQLLIFTIGTLYIFTINWILALTALAFSPFIIWITTHFSKEIRPIWDQVRKKYSKLNSVVQQNLSGNRVVKAFVRADFETEKFEEQNNAYHDINLKSVSIWIKYIPALDGLANFLTIPVILVGGILVIKGQMTLGGLVAFNGMLFVISNPMRMVGGLINEVQRFAASAEKIIELLIQKPNVSSQDHSVDTADFKNAESVVFQNVSFKYFANKVHSSATNKAADETTDKKTNIVGKDGKFNDDTSENKHEKINNRKNNNNNVNDLKSDMSDSKGLKEFAKTSFEKIGKVAIEKFGIAELKNPKSEDIENSNSENNDKKFNPDGNNDGNECANKNEKSDSTGNENSYVLKNISFTAKKGETIGIIGATGSGKSSLVNLIMRFYDATQGQIIINGKNIKEYSLQDLRSHIGIVMQEVFLFSDTVEGNIAYGNINAPIEDVIHMSKAAQADSFIRKMPQGYDTIVGERGVGLSGGQRQRIALARALCVNPSILILDDTTSAIDMETEFEIQKGLDEYFGDKTVFVIAHRISSVRKADKILVLDKGRIVEIGRHEELIAQKGIYYNVYMTQSGLLYDQQAEKEIGMQDSGINEDIDIDGFNFNDEMIGTPNVFYDQHTGSEVVDHG